MRLDLLVVALGVTESRTRAKNLISEGKITVNGSVITKPSADVPEDAQILSLDTDRFVGRGALKLEAAFELLGFADK